MGPLLLGLDFGGTKLTAGLALSGESELLARRQSPTPAEAGPRQVFEEIVRLARRLGVARPPAGDHP